MIVWNVKKLADTLAEGTFDEVERLKYFLVFIFFLSSHQTMFDCQKETSLVSSISCLVFFFIELVGVLACYIANTRGDNKDFVARYICLTLPVTIRFWVIGFVPMLILVFILRKHLAWLYFIFVMVAMLYYYVLSRWIKYVATRRVTEFQKM
jgi:hypothetical protein